MRMLEKYAVYAAGGKTKRPDLATGILIKDNHLTALQYKGIGLIEAINTAKENKYGMKVEVEVSTLEQLAEAIKANPAVILLDNMAPDEMKKAVEIVGGKIRLEASGGINLDNVEQIAASGIDAISIGAITHSASASDFSLIFPLAEEEEPNEAENPTGDAT
jgi:nicotinate-nucleotide pyrophosphorylase (carboxylating)